MAATRQHPGNKIADPHVVFVFKQEATERCRLHRHDRNAVVFLHQQTHAIIEANDRHRAAVRPVRSGRGAGRADRLVKAVA